MIHATNDTGVGLEKETVMSESIKRNSRISVHANQVDFRLSMAKKIC